MENNITKFVLNQINGLVESVNAGTADADKVFIELKKIEKELKSAIDTVFDEALTEIEKLGKGEHLINGTIVSVRASGGRWDFKNCSLWVDHKSQLENVEKHLKSLVSSRTIGDPMVDEETGEMLELPIYNPGKETIFVKIPKM